MWVSSMEQAYKHTDVFMTHTWRQGKAWRKRVEMYNTKGLEKFEAERRKELEKEEMAPVKREVEKWLREGGEEGE